MRITTHAAAAGIIAVLGLAVALPVLLDAAASRPVTVEKLSVAIDQVRKPLADANHAIGALVPARAGQIIGNPFVAPKPGRTGVAPIPDPPPPPFDLPEPPLTPFTPGG